MSYQEERKFMKENSPASSNGATDSEDEDLGYEQRWARGGPQGANETCDECGSSTDVRPVNTCRGVRHLCPKHRGGCTLSAE